MLDYALIYNCPKGQRRQENMKGSITLTRVINSSTTDFFVFGYYDTEEALIKDIEILKETHKVSKIERYFREDGYIAVYVTINEGGR